MCTDAESLKNLTTKDTEMKRDLGRPSLKISLNKSRQDKAGRSKGQPKVSQTVCLYNAHQRGGNKKVEGIRVLRLENVVVRKHSHGVRTLCQKGTPWPHLILLTTPGNTERY